MPLTSQLKPWYIKWLYGMNSHVEDRDLKEKYAVICQNLRFEDEPGAVTKREPLLKYNTSSMGSAPVKALHRFYTSDGNEYLVCAHDTSFYVGNDVTGVMTPIRTGLTAGKRFTFATYKDILYCSNGFDNIFCFDGSDDVTWEMGACKAVLTSGGSNLDSAADYYYAVTIDDDSYICGAVSNTVTTDASNRKVTLSNIPLGPAGSANRKVYRTEGGGSSLKLLATISDNTTTTYVDDIADGSLGAVMGAVTDDVPKGKYLQVHRERLFIAGDVNHPNRIYYSNTYKPWYIQQTTNTDYMDIAENDGDEITGIPIFLGVMACFKRNTIRKLHITNPVSGSSPSTWYAEDPISWEGCPAPYTICHTAFGIMYLGWNHWWIFDGVRSTPINDGFNIDSILPINYQDTIALWNKGTLHASYTDSESGNDYHDRIMNYNFIRKSLGYDTINADSMCSFSGEGESGEVYYGSSTTGTISLARTGYRWIYYRTKTQLETGALWNIRVGGTEEEPWFEIGHTETVDELTGTIDNLIGVIDRSYSIGNIEFPAIQIGAGSLGNMYWNVSLGNAGDSYEVFTRTASTEAGVEDGTATTATNATNTFTTVGHGLSNGNRIKLGGTLPTGLDSRVYYVVGVSGDDFQVSTISGGTAETFSDDGSSVTFKKWDGPLTVSDSAITSTTNTWIQVLVQLVGNSTATTPRFYRAGGYVIKFNYRRDFSSTTALETSVQFRYRIGERNFDQPFADKIHKKIMLVHAGTSGNVTVNWWTENANGSFTFPLENYPERWESFLPSNAMGREIDIEVVKDDAEDFTLKEIKGIYTPEPIII